MHINAPITDWISTLFVSLQRKLPELHPVLSKINSIHEEEADIFHSFIIQQRKRAGYYANLHLPNKLFTHGNTLFLNHITTSIISQGHWFSCPNHLFVANHVWLKV